MKKLLYITVNTKPETMSTSKTVGRQFVNQFLSRKVEYQLEELDLYADDIPEINHRLFKTRAELVTGKEYDTLSQEDKNDVDRINQLCNQFISADAYVIAAPMWSVTFPARLLRYVDCIVLNNKVIKVSPEETKGLLDDKDRSMVYIQSSGGVYPKIFSGKFNHGVDYFHDIFKFLGINKFEKLLVEGVDMPDIGRDKAIKKAFDEIDGVIDKL